MEMKSEELITLLKSLEAFGEWSVESVKAVRFSRGFGAKVSARRSASRLGSSTALGPTRTVDFLVVPEVMRHWKKEKVRDAIISCIVGALQADKNLVFFPLPARG